MRYALVSLVCLATLTGCPLKDPVPTPIDPPYPGNVAAACSDACTSLRRLGCPEGQGAVSGETCERRCVVAMELRSMPLACWAKAEDLPAAKACGALRCVR